MVKKSDVINIYGLSPMQEGMLFHALLDRQPGAYFEQFSIDLRGRLDPDIFEKTFNRLIERYDILRTVFTYKKTQRPRQVLLKSRPGTVYFEDISLLEEGAAADYLEGFRRRDRQQGFDLTRDLLMRISLFKTAADAYTLVWSFHHIIMDGWCFGILFADFVEIYHALRRGKAPQLPPVTPYRRYIDWLERQDREAGLAYWQRYLEGCDRPASLPRFKEATGEEGQYELKELRLAWDGPLSAGLMKLANRQQVTANTLFQALWGILLQRYNNGGDVVFGAVVSGRPPEIAGVQQMVGLFINTVPVRLRSLPGERFPEMLTLLQERMLQSSPHEYLPLADIQSRSPLKGRLLDHILVFENYPLEQRVSAFGTGGDAEFSIVDMQFYEQTNYDFNLVIAGGDRGEQLQLRCLFNGAVYEPAFVEKVLSLFQHVARQATRTPDIPVNDLEILSPDERRQLLDECNDTAISFPPDQTVQQLFRRQAEARAADIAVVAPAGSTSTVRELHLSYGALNRRAQQLARRLRAGGAAAATVVGLSTGRSAGMVVGLLGILESAAAYLPLDPGFPGQRIAYMLKESGAEIVVTDGEGELPPSVTTIHIMDEMPDPGRTGREAKPDPGRVSCPINPAYVIYTSGSTGSPRGVVVEQRQLVNYLFGLRRLLAVSLSRCRHFATVSTISADLGNTVVYNSLCFGGCLHVVSRPVLTDGGRMADYMARRPIDCLKMTPSHMAALLTTREPQLLLPRRLLILGGEALDPSLARQLYQLNARGENGGCEIVNHYGPTEACIGVSTYRLPQAVPPPRAIPIGTPLPNSRLYLLDHRGQPAPPGAPAELYIGGTSPAPGYLNNPELTADKFVNLAAKGREDTRSSPHQPLTPKSQILYSTGDLARRLPNGNLEFLGRRDNQVKIRGFRVEPEEVTLALKSLPQVGEAVVLPRPGPAGEPQLTAYIVTHPRSRPVVNGYRRHRLPHNLAVAHLNRNETDYIYQEIFQVQAYTRHGILLQDGDCVLDVGANIGLFSLFCRSLCRDLKIYAFEPNPPVFDILETNAGLYLPGARLFDCGLSARPGEGTFTFFEGFSLFSGLYADARKEKEVVRHFLINQQKRGVTGMAELVDAADEILEGRFGAKSFAVKLDTLSNVMAREEIRQVDLLKINAEKSELEVLRGIAPPDWHKIRQVVLEVDVRENLTPITSLLESHGFEWLVEQDVRLAGTQLCYVYAVRPSARGRLQRESRDYSQPIPSWPDDLLSDERLRELLESRLPAFMIPACFVRLERLPLTANGKLDRAALPEPGSGAAAGYIAPRHEAEEELAAIWADVLGLKKEGIGIDHSFFALGGHSLRATVLVSRINKHFNIEFPLGKVFDGPTIRQLARTIRGLGTFTYENIRPVERREYYPLSSAQKRLFFLEQFEDIGTSYQIFSSLKIEGSLDQARLERAFRALIGRHETLRTSFEMVEGEPVQRVHGEVDFKIEHYDLAASSQPAGSMDRIIEGFVRPYDLARPPLLRVGVVEGTGHPSPGGTVVLMLDMHHIVSDGTSLGILNEEMVRLYAGEELALPKVQYRDFSAWQRRLQQEGVIRQQEAYWLKQYARAVTPVVLPYDFPRPAAFSFEGDDYLFKVEAETAGRLAALSRRFGTTLYMNLLAALDVLLYRYSGQADVVVGSAILGRPHTDLERIIGMFVNALALRSYPDGERRFADFLLEVKESSIKAFENQEAQFEEVVDRLQLKRDPSRNPLFDVMFVVQNFEQPRVEVRDVAFVPFRKQDRSAKFDITLFAYEVEEEIHFKLEYCTALFRRATIGRLVGHFLNVLEAVAADPRLKIADIDLLTPGEKRRLIHDFNRTLTPFPGHHTIPHLFARQVERAPTHIALVGDDGGLHLSYGELAHRANRLAQFLLVGQGLLPNQGVGMLLDRSPDMIVAILGILQAGGAYVPLDPAYPEERLKHIIDDAALGLVISGKRYIRTLNQLQWGCASFHTFLCLDSWDVYGEEEVERSELMEQKLWEYVGQRASDDITGGGWLSSYTGRPIPRAEMEEYGDNILKKLTPLLHRQMKVLELGCGSGISMFRLAPKVGLYYGCDLSPTIIDRNRERLEREGQRNIRLACLAAHQLDRLEAEDFDLVILNSVIQCFHGHNYLRRVIGWAVKKIGKEGYLFIGDVMDQDLKADLIADLVRFREIHKDKNYTTKTDWSVELFVSRGFFLDLAAHLPEIVEVSFSPKIHTLENELTRFRYDALLRVDKTNSPGPGAKERPKHKYQLDRRVLERFRGEREVRARLLPDPLAYIIYTSGSSGRPKGTLTPHRSVIRVVKETNYIDITPQDRLLQLSNYAFDGSVFDIFGALLNGAALVQMEKPAAALAVEQLGAFLRRAQITVFFLTTALFNTLVDLDIGGLEPVRKVLFGGELVSPGHVYKAFQYLGKGRIIHVYGPTETTVYATYQPVDRLEENEQTIPIGRPLANTRTFILDRHGHPVPLGVPGELYIGGPGLARGYLNNPQLTADRFVFHQILNPKSQPLYKTGDICRWLSTGAIEFIGRLDRQVKIRGFRIEPAEVEAQLRQHPDIREAVVIVRGDGSDRSLCAYVVSPHPPTNETSPTSPTNRTNELRQYLAEFLPDYMIPSQVVVLERIPLTANGKVDQAALPEPEVPVGLNFVAPRDRLEAQLAAIWSDILAIPRGRIGVDSDFFELGGHSLKATVLTNRVHRELAVKLPLAEVFKTPCIRQLAAYIRGLMKEAGSSFSAIAPLEKRDYYPLSSAQKRLYVLQHMKSDGTGYNMPAVLSIRGRLERRRLTTTFEKLIRRHQSLRTAFGLYRDEPVQRVRDAVDFDIRYYGPGGEVGFVRAFDLAKAPLLRVGLASGRRLLLVDMHHIIADGISLGILMRDFMALYGGRELPPLQLHYKDFGNWQNRLFGTAEIRAQQAYWQAQFDGDIPVIDLPLDYPRPVVQRFEGDGLRFKLTRQQTAGLRSLLRQTDTTLFMVLLAIFNILLSRLSGQEDIVIGTPVGGRRHADLEPIIGMFVNTLALRHFPNGGKSFGEFLTEVRAAAVAAFENQDYPFEELVEGLALSRDVGRNPLFDVMLSLQNVEIPELAVPGLKLAPAGYRNKISLFDMTLTGIEGEEEIFLTIDYSDHLFKRQTIERFAGYFRRIVDAVVDDPLIRISDITILTPRELKHLVYRLNDTAAPYPTEKTLHQLFREQAERTPDYGAVALADKLLSYRELNRRSDQGAALLRERGIEPGAIVGLRLGRSLEMIVAILSILKSGSAYLPLDPDDPPERIDYIVKDSSAAALLTPEDTDMGMAEPRPCFDPFPTGAVEARAVLAYVIYTSGSTGRPKGVMVAHRSAVNLAFCQKRRFGIDTTDHILQFSTCAFDASVEQIFIALFSGALLVLIDKDTLLDLDRFGPYLREHQVTHLHAVPFFLQDVDVRELGSLRRVIAGGDVCPLSLARQLAQGVNFYNEYGPTETTVTSVELKVEKLDRGWLRLPIGRPIDNTHIYLLDRRGRPVPHGVTAEICIGGHGLAQGYLNNPQLTADKFIFHQPLNPKSQPLYRTGDLARFLPDGSLDFLGRIDHQVKIRGFRIEPAEIETHLMKHPGIQDAVVIHRQDNRQEKYLTVYIIPQTNRTSETNKLRQYLAEFLPDHMIPAHFVELEHFPLTRSGKIDRKRLPEPEAAAPQHTAPRCELEETLVKIWSQVLGVDRAVIGIDQSFFALGGHSLKATVAAAKIHQTLQVKMPLVEIFRSPTIRELAAYITDTPAYRYAPIRPVEKREYYALSPAQKRLYVLHQMAPDTINYNMPYWFYLAADMEVARLEPAFQTLIGRHESLRTAFGVVGEEPVQRIHERVDFKIEQWRLAAKDARGREGEFVRPFDLSRPPLLRVGLARGVLMLDMHHIVSDGTSHRLLEREFMSLLAGEELPGLQLQYKEYARWQNSEEQQALVRRQQDYWLRRFAGDIPVLNLPTDYPRPPMQSFAGRSVNFVLGIEETATLRRLAQGASATLYMSLLTVFNILLSKLGGQEDIVVGTPVAGRRHADLERIVGMFVNTLAIRSAPAGYKSAVEFLGEVKERTLAAFENQEYPFENLVDNVAVQRDTGRNPLFDVMLNLLNQSDDRLTMPHPQEWADTDTDRYEHVEGSAKFDLNWTVIEGEHTLLVNVEYSSRLFKPATIERLIRTFKQVLAVVGRDETIKLADIGIITPRERQQILYAFNHLGDRQEVEADQTVCRLFEDRLARCPDCTALVYRRSLVTYRELNERAKRLARRLTAEGAGPEVVVGLRVQRSPEMVIAVLGILQAGAAYLPIDPGYPPERIRFMLEDSGVSIVVTGGEGGLSIQAEDTGLDRGGGLKGRASGPSSPVYIIYTSGSSGRPKGVMLTQGNVVNLIQYQYRCTHIDFSRVLQFATISFDVSFQEIFSTLLYGGSLVLIPPDILKDIPRLFRLVEARQVRTLFLPASFLKFVFNEEAYADLFPGGIGHIVAAGEQVIVTDRLRAYLKTHGVYLHNHYGPSETHVVTALTMDPAAPIPRLPSIGRPLTNTAIYIVDRYFHLQPPGISGELLIAGLQVGRGYLNNPQLTADRFINLAAKGRQDPRSPNHEILTPKSQILYRTGDLARFLPDGTIEFLGRIDHQVKIRGFRIEPAEIESHLLRHPHVKEAVVVAGEDDRKEKHLTAYIVPQTNRTNRTNQLRQYLSLTLPDYMVPAHFVELPHIPLTANGKVDRGALPEPGFPTGPNRTAPRDEVEERVAALWSGLLGITRGSLGIDDNFFALGGHSLKATVLAARLHKEMGVELPLAEVFKTPTIRGAAEYIRAAAVQEFVPLEAAEKREYYPLSSAQGRLYILQQMDRESTVYNLPLAVGLGRDIDRARLTTVFRQLIRRHESLRTAFTVAAEEPVQRIHESVDFEIEYFDWAAKDAKGREGEFVRAFDLSRPPLLRVGLVGGHPSLGGTNILLVDLHHIIGDGVSLGLLVEEFQAVLRGEPLPRLRLQYKDYARWQNRQGQKDKHRRQQRYWLSRFAHEIPVLRLPYDYPRPPVQGFAGDSLSFTIDAPQTGGLQNLAAARGVSLFMLLLSLFNILLSRLSGQEDIVVGTAVAGRRHVDLERLVGMFVNTLALRSEPVGDMGFGEFLSAVKACALGAFENQEYPFEDLVEALSVPRQAGRNPLFDVMIALQNMGAYRGGQPGAVDFKNPVSRFDMTWNGFEGQGKLFFTVEYCTLLFKGQTIARFVDYFKRIIAQVLAQPGVRLAAIEMLSPQERKQVLCDFNDTAFAYPRHQTIPQLFALQVQRRPHRIAVVWADRCLSYRGLNREAERLAGDLADRGIGAETAVAIMGRRSVEMLVGLLGILKAGGLYVPLDPDTPEDRLRYMLADSGAEIVVSDGAVRPPVPAEKPGLDESAGRMDRAAAPSSLAYIVYTSGSTGQPRGVMVSHGSVVRLVKNNDYVALTVGKRLLPSGALEFDASTFEIWGSLLNGLTLCLLPEAEILSVNRFKASLYRYDIDIMWLTSPLFNQLLDADEELFGCLEYLLVGGDVVSPVHMNRLRARCPGLKVINGYGPTENTTFSTTFSIDRECRGPIPIGRPIANSTAYILDRHRCPVPLGVTGELWVGGDGLARGYLNNPDLTADKFVNLAAKTREDTRSFPPQPLNPKSQILYRTGDLARFLPDGNIEFLGRLDHQVKIRGFRIEPAEIETLLLRHPHIKEAVVVPGEDDRQDKHLTAYIVPQTNQTSQTSRTNRTNKLRHYLAETLPDYMIPAYFVELEHIPLTPRGKIDRKRLPTPEIKAHDAYAPPQNRRERLLLNIWSRVLGIEEREIGVNDDFFELGGHSLKAAMMVDTLQKEWGLTLPLLEIFKSPTIRLLARAVKSCPPGISSSSPKAKNLVLLRQGSAPDRHLFFIHAGSGEVDAYLDLCQGLSSAFNCWGIRAERLSHCSPRNLTIQRIAAAYIEKIKAVQAHGPYCIAGWCIGGTFAFEMVRQLEGMGQRVDLLALINTAPPQAFPAAGGERFTLESELELLAACLPHIKGREEFRGAARLHRLWSMVVRCLEASPADLHTLRRRIPANWLRAIPAADRLPVREFIRYLNVVRTFDRARNTYIPRGKMYTPLHFFSANDEEIPAKERWSAYTHRPVLYTDIRGDHFSLLQLPRVEGLTGMLNALLERAT
jgi:amino acid adenylation domain-containing protein/FkbM family methyltransferase